MQLDREQAHELMQQFAALGYIEDPGADKAKMAESADIEGKYNVARTLLWKNAPEQAMPLLEEIVRRRPWEDRFLMQLAVCYAELGHLAQSERLLAAMHDGGSPDHPSSLLMLARIKMARGDYGGALQALLAADALNPKLANVCVHLGDAYARLLQWDNAQAAYERALSLDEDNALAFQGLSTVHQRRGRNQETVDAALSAVSLLHRLPVAHYNLGVALARSGDGERAMVAFQTALRFAPGMLNAHRYLATLFRDADPEKARFHRQEAERIVRSRPRAKSASTDRSEKVWDLPEIPPRDERLRILLKERPDPKPPEAKSGKTFFIVSGLPRSGTSLMMQMLAAGGLPVLSDNLRMPDADNPRGYFEWEPIKRIGKEPELLDDDALAGHAIKCISMLLPQLPPRHDYNVIFMTRPIDEVVRSQRAMITRLSTKGAELDEEQLRRGLAAHRDEIRKWMTAASHIESLEIDYSAVIENPEPQITRIVEFIGADRLPASREMAAAIRHSAVSGTERAELPLPVMLAAGSATPEGEPRQPLVPQK